MKKTILILSLLLPAIDGCSNDGGARPEESKWAYAIVMDTNKPIGRFKGHGYQNRLLLFGRDLKFRAKVNHPTGEYNYSREDWTVECCVVSECPVPTTPTFRKDAFARACSGESSPPGGLANGHRCKGAQVPMFFPITANKGVANLTLYCTRQLDDLSVDENFKWEVAGLP